MWSGRVEAAVGICRVVNEESVGVIKLVWMELYLETQIEGQIES